ncbi:MAG: glycosyltransferase [Marmoricola sp.]
MSKQQTPQWRTVSEVVFPGEDNDDALALYLDFGRQVGVIPAGDAVSTGARLDRSKREEQPGYVIEYEGSDVIAGRHSLTLTPGRRISLGTYFNAFAAAYWRRWTDVRTVRLSVTLSGHADVLVYRSNSRGILSRIDGAINASGTDTFTFDLPLDNFADGGWYWFDLIGHDADARMESAAWQVADDPVRPGTLSIGVTTLNRTDYCKNLIENVAASAELRKVLDVLYIVDQGTQPVESEPGWQDVAAELGDQLRVIKQANLGGSGGFARGMFETTIAGTSAYHMMLDDDVNIEPEAIVRALTFASYCRRPTLVGGHMFDLLNRSVLHAYGEGVERGKWFWGPLAGLEYGVDLARTNLRAAPWMHRRVDVDYNGWWMTLVPVEVLKEIGTSIPVFIKWDDAEFGLRAAEHGYPTVSMPGVCVWHMSWTDKDDTIDWQAYYHERNRVLVALLHSPYPHGGTLLRDSLMTATKQAISMEYYAQALRNEAIRDLLKGPDHLHATLSTKLSELRAMAADFPNTTYESHPDAFPRPRSSGPTPTGLPAPRPRLRRAPLWLVRTGIRQWRPVAPESLEVPEVALTHADARWWTLSGFDSALVTKADGSGVALYRRDPDLLRSLVKESVRLHAELRRNWATLAEEYRAALPEFTSFDAWRRTFGLDDGTDGAPQ